MRYNGAMATRTRTPSTDPRRAVAYLRVSTDEQHLGPEAQRAAVEAWAARAGVVVVAWHIDAGVSGAAPVDRRPALLGALADRRNAGSNFTLCPAVIEGYYHRGAVGEVGSCESAPPAAAVPRVFGAPPPPTPRVPQRAYACLGGCQERQGAASRAAPPPGILANLDGAPKRTEADRSAPPLAPGRRNPTPHLPRARATRSLTQGP